MPSQRYRYQKMILQRLIFCINEACVNCGKENATTLTWLLRDAMIIVKQDLPLFTTLHCVRQYYKIS